jgi:hypothetical protein
MLRKGILAAALICSAMLAVAPGRAAAPDVRNLDKNDLSIVIGAYVDSVVELRQLLLACARTEPLHWDEASAALAATLRATGFDESEAAALTARLAVGKQGSASYDCGSELVATRLSMEPSSDWVELHKAALADIGIAIVIPGPSVDPRLDAVHAVFARHLPEQARMLRCMALVQTRWFPLAYADWEAVVDKAEAALHAAGYSAEIVASIVDPARSGRLLIAVADRQADIADCIGETNWMTRYSTFTWYSLAGEVDAALAASP